MAVHAIGDAAVSAAIQAAEAQADSSGAGARDVRFRVEHAQHLPSPLESFPRRARRVGAVVSAQPAQMALDRASVVENVHLQVVDVAAVVVVRAELGLHRGFILHLFNFCTNRCYQRS